jgi:hypothetical protein
MLADVPASHSSNEVLSPGKSHIQWSRWRIGRKVILKGAHVDFSGIILVIDATAIATLYKQASSPCEVFVVIWCWKLNGRMRDHSLQIMACRLWGRIKVLFVYIQYVFVADGILCRIISTMADMSYVPDLTVCINASRWVWRQKWWIKALCVYDFITHNLSLKMSFRIACMSIWRMLRLYRARPENQLRNSARLFLCLHRLNILHVTCGNLIPVFLLQNKCLKVSTV